MARTGVRPTGLRVLIAGGGVAGLEAMLALRALADERVDIELLAPEPYFWYRPLAVAEPFQPVKGHFDLATLVDQVGAGLTIGALASVDVDGHVVRTTAGAEFSYDVLVLAIGTSPSVAVEGAFTFRGPADAEGYGRILAEVEAGTVDRLVFAVPGATVWPLPAYELALQTAAHVARAWMPRRELTIVTPEVRPLGLFGIHASETVASLLKARNIALRCGSYPVAVEGGSLSFASGGSIACDRAIALPHLRGQPIGGIEQDDRDFVSVDEFGLVRGTDDVYAAGDMTDFPVKQGGIATQQADAVATAVAARAGAPVTPEPFQPVLRAILLTGEVPLYLRAEPPGGLAADSLASDEQLWWPPAKIAGRYLAPFLAERLRSSG